jgi:beta-aspartyl-dipeptidase (metallo-type)
MTMRLIKGAELYAPQPSGRVDLLLGGGRVLAVGSGLQAPEGAECEVVDATGLTLIPGLIDVHAHIAGAGGEGGPSTRTPEMGLSRFVSTGITSVVGSLGTDGMTRSVEAVLMKAKGLRAEGMSAWILTGAYQVPTPTLLGDVGKDVACIEEVIGAGEIAVSDHRSSCPSVSELIRIAEHARVGGMLGGKAGLTLLHMGDADKPFDILRDAVAASMLKPKQFVPTHCNRNSWIYEDAKTYGKEGYLDITTSAYPFFPDDEIKPSKALGGLLAAGVPAEHVTFSSDAGGSLPMFDENGRLLSLTTGDPATLLDEVLDCVREEGLPLDTALRVATTNPADTFKLSRKGRVAEGMDADLVLLDEDMGIRHVLALGEWMLRDGKPLKKGTFE